MSLLAAVLLEAVVMIISLMGQVRDLSFRVLGVDCITSKSKFPSSFESCQLSRILLLKFWGLIVKLNSLSLCELN